MEEERKQTEVTIGEYKGSPTITLPTSVDGRFPFTFGLAKAKAILKYLEDIKKFVEQHDKSQKS